MMGKKLIAGLCAILLLVSSFSAAAASYQHGDKVKVTVSESWAFHGGRAPGETSTSNGGNRENHYNNRLYWYEGYSIDILHVEMANQAAVSAFCSIRKRLSSLNVQTFRLFWQV